MQCLAVCDGTGPAIYRDVPPTDAGSAGSVITTIDMQGLLPDRGSMSVYVLLRGTGTLRVEVSGDSTEPVGAADFRRNMPSSWEDVQPVRIAAQGGKSLTWGNDPNSRPPKTMTLYAADGAVALEIDCIIPVVTQ